MDLGNRVRVVLGDYFGREGEIIKIDGDRVQVRGDGGGKRTFPRASLMVIDQLEVGGGTPPTSTELVQAEDSDDPPMFLSGGTPSTVRIEAGGRVVYPTAPSDSPSPGEAIALNPVLAHSGGTTPMGGGTPPTEAKPAYTDASGAFLPSSGGTAPTPKKGESYAPGVRLTSGGTAPTPDHSVEIKFQRAAVLLDWLAELEKSGTLDAWIETEKRGSKTLYRVVYHAHLGREPHRISAKDAPKLKADIERGRWARQIRALLKCPDLS
jgi:hypothetical protein